MRANLAFNDTKGNVDNRTNNDVTYDGLGGLEVGTLVNDLTSRFRDGRIALASNRAIVLNLVGIKRWQIGNHSVNTGAYLSYREGQPWGFQANANMFNPESLETLRVRTLLEPADTSQLPDPTVLNLNASWVFPIKGSFEGQLGVEVWNATNEDAQTNVECFKRQSEERHHLVRDTARVPGERRYSLLRRRRSSFPFGPTDRVLLVRSLREEPQGGYP